MRYLLMIYTPELDPATVPPAQVQAQHEAYGVFTREVRERKVMEAGEALTRPPDAGA